MHVAIDVCRVANMGKLDDYERGQMQVGGLALCDGVGRDDLVTEVGLPESEPAMGIVNRSEELFERAQRTPCG
jgi:hypothetical protein